MAIIQNTIRYYPDASYVDLATNTTLGTATRLDTPARTITIEETGTRTFRSVKVRVHFQDRFTVANEITGIRMGVKLGAAAAVDVDRSWTMANTGDHARECHEYDATSYFTTNFGAGATQTFIASLAVSTTTASNIGGSIWFEVIITYDYDDTSGTKRMRCIPILLQSHHTFLTAGAMVEFGTTAGVSNAPANQIPALDTYLEEASKTYCDMGLVWHCNTGATATDINPSIQVDATGAVAMGLIGQALNTARQVWGMYNYPFGTHATNAVHAIKAQTDVASMLLGFGGILWVTYSYTISGTTRGMYCGMVPLEEQGSIDGHGPTRTISPSDATAADAFVWECVLDIQEPGTITLKQSGVAVVMEGISGGAPSIRCGAQSYRATLGGTGQSTPLIHRGDHSSGWTVARGVNRLTFSAYMSLQNRIVMDGVGYIVYSADIPAAGPDRGNRVLNFVANVADTTPAVNYIVASAGQHAPVFLSPWKINAYMYEMLGRAARLDGARNPELFCELSGTEYRGVGWVIGRAADTAALAELGCQESHIPMTRRFFNDSLEQTAAIEPKMDPQVARRFAVNAFLSAILPSISVNATVHNITYAVAGVVEVGGSPVADGKTVKIFTVNGRYLGSTVTTGGTGSFTLAVPFNTTLCFASYVDGSNLSRSDDGTPGSSSFDISIATGGGDTTDPVLTVISYPVTPSDPLVVSVYDATSGLSAIELSCRDRVDGKRMVVYSTVDHAFIHPFSGLSTVTGSGTSGSPYIFTVYRRGRWPTGISLDVRVQAIDSSGNEVNS